MKQPDIYQNVLSAMEPAEAEGAPEGMDYVRLMAEIAQEAVTRIDTFAQREDKRIEAANTFMQELLDSVETLTGLAEVCGIRTLVDLFYLHTAILNNGFIYTYPGSSGVLEVASKLPSGPRWSKYITVERLLGRV